MSNADLAKEEGSPPPTSAPPSMSRPPHPSTFPFQLAPGLSNFRDIGGWPIIDPRISTRTAHVRTGLIFRGSDTNRIAPAGITKLQDLGIKTDFDLRSKQQIENAGGYRDMGELGIERKWTPVFREESYTEEAARKRYELYAGDGTDGIVEAFMEILTEGAQMIAVVLRYLLFTVPEHPDPAPAVFLHCTTGNNRTGAFISILLLLLHVPPATVVHEYCLSEQGLAPTRYINIERLLKKGAFKGLEEAERRRKLERMVGAREESMWALIREAERVWGGAEGYFLNVVRLRKEEIERVKKMLTAWEDRKDEAETGAQE